MGANLTCRLVRGTLWSIIIALSADIVHAAGCGSLTNAVFTVWSLGASGNWVVNTNWTNNAPNSGKDACVIDGVSTVSLGTGGSVASMQIGSGNGVTVGNGGALTVAGSDVKNAGSLSLSSTGSFTDLLINPSGGTLTLSGAGTFSLSNTPNNRVYSTTGATFVNQSTIQGSGQLGINNAGFAFTLKNSGTINANQSSALQVAPSNTVTNTGTLEATAGGTLNLIASVNNSGGTILSAGSGSLVELNGSTINGGTLTTSSGGVIRNSGTATVNGVTISSGSTLTLANAGSTTAMGTITNNGTIAQNSTGSFTDLHVSGTVTLTGSGSLTLSNTVNNRIFATGSDSLTNDVNHTIQGAGQLGINNGGFGFTLTNKGTINANQSSALQIAPTGTVTNTGTIEATAGGTLNLIATVNNAGGLIQSTGASSVVDFNGSTINGGTLTTSSGGTIQNSGTATVNGVTVSSGSTLTLANASSTTAMGTITNNGTIAQNSTGSFTDLLLSGAVTLTGSGSLTLSNSPNNRVYATGFDSLINDVNHKIQGAGQLGINNAGFAFTLTNNGTINANQSGGTLQIAPTSTVINTGTLEATGGGTLALIGAFTNTGGTILGSGASSVVEFNGSTITGGTLTTTGGGTIQNSGTATVSGVAISSGSTLTLANASSTTAMGTITNNGTILQNSTGSFTDLRISGAATLTGSGSLTLSNSPNNRIFATGTDSLINDVNHTIQGAGQLGINNAGFSFTLANKGTINANQSNLLQVAPTGTVTNTGTIEATAGGTMNLIATVNNAGGLIQATGSGSVVDLSGSTINGGTLTTAGGGVMQNSGTATVNGVTVSSGSTLTLFNASSTTAMGTITNNGTIAQNSTGSFTDLHISGAVTLTGSGSLTLSNSPNNRVYATGFDSLINDVSHTIQGAGQLGINNSGFAFTFTNDGMVLANQSNTLQVAPGNVTNNGTFQVNAGSTMAVLANLTNFAANTLTGGTYDLNGALFPPAKLEIDALGNTGGEIVTNAATIILNGLNSNFVDAAGKDALSNFAANSGAGSFTIRGGRFLTTSGNFTNAGMVDIGAGSTLNVNGGTGTYTQSGGTTQLDGGLAATGGVSINGGTLIGNDPVGIVGNVTMAGTLSPGDAPGTAGRIDITGNYTQTAAGIFDLGIGGLTPGSQFDLLSVTGMAGLGGTLNVSLENGFFPSFGDTIIFLLAGAGVKGKFDTVNGLNLHGEILQIVYNANSVELIATPAPEPSALLMLGLGLLGLYGKARSKPRR